MQHYDIQEEGIKQDKPFTCPDLIPGTNFSAVAQEGDLNRT